jgi:hypothetical protein
MIGRVGAQISDVSMHRGPFCLDHLRDLHTRCGRLQRPPLACTGWDGMDGPLRSRQLLSTASMNLVCCGFGEHVFLNRKPSTYHQVRIVSRSLSRPDTISHLIM